MPIQRLPAKATWANLEIRWAQTKMHRQIFSQWTTLKLILPLGIYTVWMSAVYWTSRRYMLPLQGRNRIGECSSPTEVREQGWRLAPIHPNHFDREQGARTYLWNYGNAAHIHVVQRPKKRININTGPPWKPKINNVKRIQMNPSSATEILTVVPL
jgi:hypothetical protein